MKEETLTGTADTFARLGLSAAVLKALHEEGYERPTPIQTQAVPHVLAGRDLFGCAQTGTGKTAAFALPMIERLSNAPQPRPPKGCRTLVLAPTRELAAQIHDGFRAYGRHARLRTAVVYGGVGQNPQVNALRHGVDVLIATPGRLLDLHHQRFVDLRHVETLVLDEADRMLDMGFIHDVRRIVGCLPRDRQTLFFSATLPDEVRSLASSMLRDPVEVKTARQSTPAERVDQSVMFVPQRRKRHVLAHLLKHEAMARVIVFTRTKHGADKLVRDLEKSGVCARAIHGNKSQSRREQALAEFKSPNPPVLVATDIAARGIDVDEVSHVVNFDLPHEPETYVHRIGRTGRAGLTGSALAFCDAEERPRLRAIEKLLRTTIAVRDDVPAVAAEESGPAPAANESRLPHEPRERREAGRSNRSSGGGRRRRRATSVIGGDAPHDRGRRSEGSRTGAAVAAHRRDAGKVVDGAPIATLPPPAKHRKTHRRAL